MSERDIGLEILDTREKQFPPSDATDIPYS